MAAPSEKFRQELGPQNDPENEDVTPDLDLMSPTFDPLKALYASTVVLPMPSAKCFNNLGEYESYTTGRGRGKGRGQSEHAQRRRRKKDLAAQAAGLVDSKQKASTQRNVLTRMAEHTKGPYSLLYTCVQRRIKVRVCVRSFKGLRGICTGYLVAFDRDMNMAMSDVDEVYRIPSTGQRFFHEEKLTFSKIIECSKIRPSGKHGVMLSHQSRRKGTDRGQGSSRDRGQGSSGDREQGSSGDRDQGSNRESYTDRKTRTKLSQGSKDCTDDAKRDDKSSSRTEDRRKRERRKDEDERKQEDEKALHLKLENLKKELERLSSEDSGSQAPDEPKVKGCDLTKLKDEGFKRKTSSSSEEQLLEPMAFEKQLLKSRASREKLSGSEKGQGQSSKFKPTQDKGQSAKVKCGGGKIMIEPEEFQRRHVNQLFVRGDNVVLVSVDKASLGTRW